jgi:hypothetical protein
MKYKILVILLIILSALTFSGFKMLPPDYNELENSIKITIKPKEIAEQSYIYLNNSYPINYREGNFYEYSFSKNDKNIKIEIQVPIDSKYKDKTIFISPETKEVNIRLTKTFSEESKNILNLIIELVNSINKYQKSGNMADFREASKNFNSIVYLNYFIEDLKYIDKEEINNLLEFVKTNINLTNDQYDIIFDKTVDSSKKLVQLTYKLNSYSNQLSETEKQRLQSELIQETLDVWWDIFDIIENFKILNKK